MPRTRSNAAAANLVELVKPVEHEEQVDDDDPEEMEEEVEYEEIEEEVEEEEEEVVEEEIEEEPEDDEEEMSVTNGTNTGVRSRGDAGKGTGEKSEDESKKHAELMALPPHGSEVFVGGIPLDASEEELRSFCEPVGEVTEVRVMKAKDSAENKGYAFVTFKTKELAAKAIKQLNNTEFKGKKVKCSTSQAKHRLFIGNVPRNWTEDDLKKVVTSIGPGVNKVELMKDPQNSSRNRGYVFIEYYNHACAEYSKNKMSSPDFKLDTNAPTVSWAEPRTGDSSSTSQVKAIYVKNLPKDVTQLQLKKLFEHHGEIVKVVLPPGKPGHEKRYGFVHFKERTMAMKALQNAEKYELDGEVLECSLAKPPAESKKVEPASSSQKAALLPNYAPRVGYGVLGGGYGTVSPGLGQPMLYGRGQTPAGIAMVPMILPDGRLGYVLQQPGVPVPSQQHGGSRGGSSSGGLDPFVSSISDNLETNQPTVSPLSSVSVLPNQSEPAVSPTPLSSFPVHGDQNEPASSQPYSSSVTSSAKQTSAPLSLNQNELAPSFSQPKDDITEDLQDLLTAARSAAETAEHAAKAARAAADLAQIKIADLTTKRSNKTAESYDHGQGSEHPTSLPNQTLVQQGSFDSNDNTPTYGQECRFDSPTRTPHELPFTTHVPQRSTSLEDDPYFSYPNLFTSKDSDLKSGLS